MPMGVRYCPHAGCNGPMYPLSILSSGYNAHYVCLNHETPYHEIYNPGSVTQFSKKLTEKELAGLKRVQEKYASYSRKILKFLEKVEDS